MIMTWNNPTTKEDLLEALDEAMEIIQAKTPRLAFEYEQCIVSLCEQIGKLRSLVNHLP